MEITELLKGQQEELSKLVSSAVVKNLGGVELILDKMIQTLLSEKVSNNGRPSSNSYENKSTFIEWLMRDYLAKIVKETAGEYFSNNQEKLKELVTIELHKSLPNLAKNMAESMTDAVVKSYYSVNVSFDVKQRNNED